MCSCSLPLANIRNDFCKSKVTQQSFNQSPHIVRCDTPSSICQPAARTSLKNAPQQPARPSAERKEEEKACEHWTAPSPKGQSGMSYAQAIRFQAADRIQITCGSAIVSANSVRIVRAAGLVERCHRPDSAWAPPATQTMLLDRTRIQNAAAAKRMTASNPRQPAHSQPRKIPPPPPAINTASDRASQANPEKQLQPATLARTTKSFCARWPNSTVRPAQSRRKISRGHVWKGSRSGIWGRYRQDAQPPFTKK